MNRFTSRKFLLTLGTVLTLVGSGLTGVLGWPDVAKLLVTAVIAYVAAEGVGDAVSRYHPHTDSFGDLPSDLPKPPLPPEFPGTPS